MTKTEILNRVVSEFQDCDTGYYSRNSVELIVELAAYLGVRTLEEPNWRLDIVSFPDRSKIPPIIAFRANVYPTPSLLESKKFIEGITNHETSKFDAYRLAYILQAEGCIVEITQCEQH